MLVSILEFATALIILVEKVNESMPKIKQVVTDWFSGLKGQSETNEVAQVGVSPENKVIQENIDCCEESGFSISDLEGEKIPFDIPVSHSIADTPKTYAPTSKEVTVAFIVGESILFETKSVEVSSEIEKPQISDAKLSEILTLLNIIPWSEISDSVFDQKITWFESDGIPIIGVEPTSILSAVDYLI